MSTQFSENRKQFVEEVCSLLDKDQLPWVAGWDGYNVSFNFPQNGKTGKKYRGFNAVNLLMAAIKKNYSDGRWLTYKQAQDLGCNVRKGEKSVAAVEVFKFYDKLTKKDLDWEMFNSLSRTEQREYFKNNVYTMPKVYRVFNGEQIEGLEPINNVVEEKKVSYEKIDTIIKNSGVKIKYAGASAFYDLTNDSITLPPKESFVSENSYYATALHELAHSTGNASRLNREIAMKSYRDNKQARAEEELVAEFTSLFVCAEKNIVDDRENHKAYCQSWAKYLRENPNKIFEALAQAEKATELILSYENVKEFPLATSSDNKYVEAINSALNKIAS